MTDIQLFQDALSFDFPIQLADQVLAKIEGMYGAEFDKKFGHIDADTLRNNVCDALSGITPNQLRRGVERMRSEDFCPTLPRFRQWCLEDKTWWTAELAWAKALQFEADPTVRITKLTKVTLDEVRHIITLEGQKPAHKAFIAIYDDYLQKAIARDHKQDMYQAPVVQQLTYTEVPKGVPCPPDLAEKIKVGFKKVGGLA